MPATKSQHTYHFPAVIARPNIGVAHYGTPRDNQHLDAIGAYYWYGNSAFAYLPDNRVIPLARPFNANLVRDNLGSEYNGYMLVGNEGESGPGAGDDLAPAEMADFVGDVRGWYPAAHLVCLNSYDLDYMTAVIALLPDDICHAWGVHVTYLLGDTAVSEWLDGLCTDCLVWVTEIGWSNDDTAVYSELYRLVYEARQDSRVQMIFAYTTSEADNESVNMIDDNGLLLPNGAAFRDAVKVVYP